VRRLLLQQNWARPVSSSKLAWFCRVWHKYSLKPAVYTSKVLSSFRKSVRLIHQTEQYQ
jgi:hypothetical protein